MEEKPKKLGEHYGGEQKRTEMAEIGGPSCSNIKMALKTLKPSQNTLWSETKKGFSSQPRSSSRAG